VRSPVTRRIGPPRAGTVIVAAVAAVVGLVCWLGVASVGAIDHSAGQPPVEMVRAVPATYQPVVPAASAAAQETELRIGNRTPQRGVEIARRALRWLNWPYSFAGGGPAGPSYGKAVDWDSRNDGHVYGFDCSGLVMYALAPWMSLKHDAAVQYSEVGTFHPSINSLLPGDLVFWSDDGTVNGIGHVAVYIGGGLVVQAPHSGDVVRETPINEVESGTMGATRPLT
jgi:cell wall-associated NlpC family hydrolase